MQQWISAIIEVINASDLQATMGAAPQVFLDIAPAAATLPLVVVTAKTSVVTHDLALNRYTTAEAQIAVYSPTLALALAGAQVLQAALDMASFAVVGGTLLNNRTTPSPMGSAGAMDGQSEPVYAVTLGVQGVIFEPR